MSRILFLSTLAATVIVSVAGTAQAEARVDWMVKAYGDGEHNAFTDLIQWKGDYYLCFRHGTGHVSMDGEIRVMRSKDLKAWTPCGTLRTFGDDRDPHFAATEDSLYVYFGVWDLVHDKGHGTPDRGCVRSHFASSTDGETWSEVRGIYEPGYWMWRVRHHDGAFYSVGYTAIRPRPSVRESRVLRSENGLDWEVLSVATNERLAGEADMWFNPDGSMWFITRTGDKPGDSMILTSDATKTQWQRQDTGVLIHSPALVKWKGRFFVAGRGRGDGGYVTKLWKLVGHEPKELLTLPSGGDTAYPGLLVDPATENADHPAFFVSWYSQHEKDQEPNGTKHTASVYVARVVLEP